MNSKRRLSDPSSHAPSGPADDAADFVNRLERKLAHGNLRRWQRLTAWAGLLDAAGWCVALAEGGDSCWLGERARKELQRQGEVPATWAELTLMLGKLPESCVVVEGEWVRVWSDATPAGTVEPPAAAPLTKRETEVWHWIRHGKTGPEIAVILGCATRTVETHVANLYKKIGVKHRGAAILGNPFKKE